MASSFSVAVRQNLSGPYNYKRNLTQPTTTKSPSHHYATEMTSGCQQTEVQSTSKYMHAAVCLVAEDCRGRQ